MSTIIPFPIIARPVPQTSNPAYRRGVEDAVAAVLRCQRGYERGAAQVEAHRLTAIAFDGLPNHAGEGEY